MAGYGEKGKTPYQYTFRRCAHAREQEHVQSYSIMGRDRVLAKGKVRVCGVCNTMRGEAFSVHTRIIPPQGSAA